MQQTISIVIPVMNEGDIIVGRLKSLQYLRAAGHEILVVDGGSADDTAVQAEGLADRVVASRPGRSKQMNAGAQIASGDVLLFLHIDTELPAEADRQIFAALEQQKCGWGWFDVRLSEPNVPLRVVARMMNLRARLSTVCTGDQALFVERPVFTEAGGFPDIALMEDVAISKVLRRTGKAARPAGFAIASSRRWKEKGLLATILLMWKLRLLYFIGVEPSRLALKYYPRHER